MIFEDTVIYQQKTGSRYICNPPVMGTDDDTVFLVNGFYDWAQLLRDDGFSDEQSEIQYNTMGEFISFRKGDENYIVTENPSFYMSYVIATEAAKALNLLKKEERVTLFQSIHNNYAPPPSGLLKPPKKIVGIDWVIAFNHPADDPVNF